MTASEKPPSQPLLELRHLKTHFFGEEGVVRAVDGVNLSVSRGEILCVVGESGSGKSVANLSILGLVPDPPGRIVGGQILFHGGDELVDLAQLSQAELRVLRGDRIAMIFQDPMTSLNPYLKIGLQLSEVLELHRGMARKQARQKAAEMLGEVGIPDPVKRLDDYPHQLSGGMRQRVMVAMALLCQPQLLIADEPTTALDVTVQAQILELIKERRDALDLAVILVTHDLGVVATVADRVAVMYAGRVVEEGSVDGIFEEPQHPYTRALQASVPRIEGLAEGASLHAIKGAPPSPRALPSGCAFHPRCAQAEPRCREEYPEERLLQLKHGPQRVSCHLVQAPGPEVPA